MTGELQDVLLIQNFAQPLDFVEENIPLFNHSVVLRRLEGRAGSFDNAMNLVDRCMKSTVCNKAR